MDDGKFGVSGEPIRIYAHTADEATRKIQFYDLFQKIFYMSITRNETDVIPSILAAIGSYLDVSRAYIFRISPDGLCASNTAEWCADGVLPVKAFLSSMPVAEHIDFLDRLCESGQINVSAMRDFDDVTRESLEFQGVKAIAVNALYINGKFSGFVGLDETRRERLWEHNDMEMLRSASIIISTLIEKREAELESRRAREILGAVIDSMDELVYVIDMETNCVIYANKMVLDTYGSDVVGRQCHEVMYRRSAMCGDCPRQELLAEGSSAANHVSVREMRSPITKCWYWIKCKIITWHDGRKVQLCCASDVTAKKRNEQNLIRLTQTDRMTGVYSRDFGLRMLKEALEGMENGGEPLTVCFMDVDGLKTVNDTFGHAEGDRLIMAVVDAVNHSTRAADAFVRMGGDEFLLILRGTAMKGAEKVVNAINTKLDSVNKQELYPYEISVSMGLYEVMPDGGESVDVILGNADREMYIHKLDRRKTRE